MEKIFCLHTLFGATRLLNFRKLSYLHYYLDLLVYFQVFVNVGNLQKTPCLNNLLNKSDVVNQGFSFFWKSDVGYSYEKYMTLHKIPSYWEFFFPIFSLLLPNFPTYTFISPYTFIGSSQNYPSYTFIWHYTFIRFFKIFLPTSLFGLHVYLEH